MSPYTRRFVHSTLNMRPNTGFIHRSVDRPNIYIGARKIRHGIATHRDLYFLFPPGCSHPREIPQTVVFTDNRKDAHHACAEFWNLVPNDWKALYPFTFAECSTINTAIRRWTVMAAFRAGVCRILFATEVAGMGVDFPTVERVIQWRIGANMTIASLLQRLGRACRSPNSQGVFLLFYTRPYIIPHEPDHPMFVYTADPAGDPRLLQKCISGVADWAQGKKSQSATDDPLDAPVVPYAQSDTQSVSSDLINMPPATVDEPQIFPGEVRSDFGEFDFPDEGSERSDPTEPSTGSESDHESDDDTEDLETVSSESAGSPGPESDHGSLASSNESTAPDRPRRRGFPAGCRGIVWFINTTGCRRAVLRVLHDDAGYDSWDHIVDSDVVVPGTETCCDRHCPAYAEELPDAIRRLLEPVDEIEPQELSTEDAASELPDTVPIKQVSRLRQQHVRQALQAVRDEIHWEISKGDIFFPYAAQAFISDDYINKWCRGCGSINSETDLLGRISTETHSPQHLMPFLPRILVTIQDTLERTQPPPARKRGRRPIERAQFIPPHIIPSDADLEDEYNQQLLAENEMLRAEHELNEDKLEAQRLKQKRRRDWNKAPRSDRHQRPRGRSGLRESNTQVNYTQAPNSSEPEVTIGNQASVQPDITEAQPLPDADEAERILPSDIYAERHIPSDVQSRLPKRRRGRPSTKENEERRKIIKEYWKNRGYMSSENAEAMEEE
jgi:hypothetical protein